MSTSALRVRGLSKSFGDETVLQGIDLTVEQGEYCVILGPSGSGKSTLLRCLAGIDSPNGGEVVFDGTDHSFSFENGLSLAMVFQDFEDRLFPHMTVAENIAFGLRQQDQEYTEAEIEEKVDDALAFVAIKELKSDKPENLSGGQQQRVELARQLVRETDLMLLDDPLGDLDYKLQKRLELDLRRIHADSERTFLHVTHDQDEALKLADKLVVLNDGQIEQSGPTEEVYENPRTVFTGRFVGNSNIIAGKASKFEGNRIELESEVGPLTASYHGDEAESDELGATLVRPEAIDLNVDPESYDNSLRGDLVNQNYTGQYTEFTFRIEGLDSSFEVHKPGEASVNGNRFHLGWSAEDTQYFPPSKFSVSGNLTVADLKKL